MNSQGSKIITPIFSAITVLALVGCATLAPPEGSAEVRSKLTTLQTNQELASRAPVAIKNAEVAVRAAEIPEKDVEVAQHRVMLADGKVDIAIARAQARLLEDQRTALSQASEAARLEARTLEADQAARDASSARQDAELARGDADFARNEAEAARLKAAALQGKLDELNAKETERGIVITLGDVLFATGRSELSGGAASGLSKLVGFLNEYPDRKVAIEGHTDSVGSESSNASLSQRRADAVRGFLANQGIASARMRTSGMGEGLPVASNDTATGRQQNRRVEVIIEN